MTAATVTYRPEREAVGFPWSVDCEECGNIAYRSDEPQAQAHAADHTRCNECVDYDSRLRQWVPAHCHYECRQCFGHCDSLCEDCEEHCTSWAQCCDDNHCRYECDYCGGHCRYECVNCDDHHESEEDRDDDCIWNYSYKPDPIFHGQGKLHVGLELEVSWEDYSDGVDWVNEWVEPRNTLWYAKEDGSVRGGFEVVTHPMSTKWALRNFPFNALDDGLNRGAIRSHESCGTHIHISRAGLNGRQWWTLFAIHRKLPRLCGVIGGRGIHSQWADWDSGADILSRPITAKNAKHSLPYGRYVPINALPDHTLELRYPMGDFSPEGVKRNVQWVEALTTFGRDLTCRELKVTDDAMLAHIEQGPWPQLQRAVATY